MRYAMTTWKVAAVSDDHTAALKGWQDHCRAVHPQIKDIRCYTFNGGTEYVWLEEFDDYKSYQELVDSFDGTCEAVMDVVLKHVVPGTLRTGIWMDAL